MFSILQITVAFLVIRSLISSQQEKCAVLEFYHLNENALSVAENHFANVTFGMNITTCRHTVNTAYKVTLHTRTNSGSLEYDGTITYLRDTCNPTPDTAVRCISATGPAELYRKVNRTHVAVEWTWLWKDVQFGNFTAMQQELKLIVFYPPSVTSLTVNGHNVQGYYLINESQEVNISCFVDKGNPPANFRFLDKHGTELKSYEGDLLLLTLTAHCKQEWPTVRCEANSSEKNRSVSFLVSCPPQFIEEHPQVTASAEHERWTLRVKAHTTEIEKCLVMPLSFGGNKNIEVNCSLTGVPPHLLLTVFVKKGDSTKGENWALSFRNEKGSSDTLVFNKHLGIVPAFHLQRHGLNPN